MRVYYFFLLPSAALAVIITKSSETSQSTVHLVPIRDVADRHRSGSAVNRALRAQNDLDDEERAGGAGAFDSVVASVGSKVAEAMEEHAATPVRAYNFDKTTDNFARLTAILRKHPNEMYLTEMLQVEEATLVTKLVDVYGDEVIAQGLVRLSLKGEGVSPVLRHLRDLMCRQWSAHKTPEDMITWIRATKDFKDKYLYRPEVATFLQHFESDNVNKAIMEAYGNSFAHYVSVLYRAHRMKRRDEPALKAAWGYLYRLHPEEYQEDFVFPAMYAYSVRVDSTRRVFEGEPSYEILDSDGVQKAYKIMMGYFRRSYNPNP